MLRYILQPVMFTSETYILAYRISAALPNSSDLGEKMRHHVPC